MANERIKWPNVDGGGFWDYVFGNLSSRYRRWRGGYWWYSTVTDRWWRHKEHDQSKALVEDYR